jgi:hypothetical protein
MNEHYYLYALTRSGYPADPLGPGEDALECGVILPRSASDSWMAMAVKLP